MAATSKDSQRSINVHGPLAGRAFESAVIETDAVHSLTGYRMRVSEPGLPCGSFRTASGTRTAGFADDRIRQGMRRGANH